MLDGIIVIYTSRICSNTVVLMQHLQCVKIYIYGPRFGYIIFGALTFVLCGADASNVTRREAINHSILAVNVITRRAPVHHLCLRCALRHQSRYHMIEYITQRQTNDNTFSSVKDVICRSRIEVGVWDATLSAQPIVAP